MVSNVVPLPTSINPSTYGGSAPSPVTAPQPSMPSPIYSGPAISSAPALARILGALYQEHPMLGTVSVNGTHIKPTSYANGQPHASVRHVAMAAGVPPEHIQTDKKGKTLIYSHTHIDPTKL